MRFLKYNTYIRSVTGTSSVPVDSLCNGYTIKNAGNTILMFRNEQILPGDFKSVGGNYGEITVDRIDITFGALIGPPPAVNQGYVTQKIYILGEGFDNPKM